MPHIIVMADAETDRSEETEMLRERISLDDLQSRHFATQLLERLNWAVGDAQAVEQPHRNRNRGTDAEPIPARARSRVAAEATDQPPASVVTTAS